MSLSPLLRAVSVLFISLFIFPVMAQAQQQGNSDITVAIPKDTSANSQDMLETPADTVTERVAEMPLFTPGNDAEIKIFEPPKDIFYNMPIIGKRDTSTFGLQFID